VRTDTDQPMNDESRRGTVREDSDALVKFREVQKTFDGETLVIKNLNLDIEPGEFLTLLGPSGSGKTTTLMMLAGFEVPTHGEILLAGRSLRNVPPHKRDIGMVFQNYALFPHMTVEENLAFPLQARKMPAAEIGDRIGRVLDMVQLAPFGKRRPGQLSGGQQQRVAVARALVYEPQLVLMDEPLGALDKQLREQMQLEIKHIHDSVGVTVVYVTHDQSEALTMSNRIAVFNDGEIQQLADPKVLYEEPENAFVAQFIGENNRFSGRFVEINGGDCLVEVEGGFRIRALVVHSDVAGAPVSLSLRPESVQINPPTDRVANLFDARVEELIYLGDYTRVRISVCGSDEFVVKVARTDRAPQLDVGQDITVGWHSKDCRALDPL